MLERKDNNASQEELFHHQSHSPQSEVIQKANMFAAVWINKFAHAQTHRESITESLKNLANDSKESVHWEPVLNKNRFSIPIPSQELDIYHELLCVCVLAGLSDCSQSCETASQPILIPVM